MKKNKLRFNNLPELKELLKDYESDEFEVSEEELQVYISSLSPQTQHYLKQTSKAPTYRGIKLVINGNEK